MVSGKTVSYTQKKQRENLKGKIKYITEDTTDDDVMMFEANDYVERNRIPSTFPPKDRWAELGKTVVVGCEIEDANHKVGAKFKDPEELIKHIMDNWLKPFGQMIMGVDHYYENIKSHSWPTDLNTYMKLLSIDDWIELFKDCGLGEVKAFQANAKDDFPGTLIVHGLKGRGS